MGISWIAYLLDERLPSIDMVIDALREIAGQTVLDPSIVEPGVWSNGPRLASVTHVSGTYAGTAHSLT